MVLNGDPITRNVPASEIYGDSQHYGPIIIPKEKAVEAAGVRFLGQAVLFFGINRPGLFAKDFGTHKIAWSAAAPFPGPLLRELARYGGCHVWCDENDVIMASDTVAAIHTVKDGPRTLRLPSKRTVWDLMSREKLGDNLTEISLEMNSPDTRVFYMGENLPE